jgi:hypothetical protein
VGLAGIALGLLVYRWQSKVVPATDVETAPIA